jgi:hypothetical protein
MRANELATTKIARQAGTGTGQFETVSRTKSMNDLATEIRFERPTQDQESKARILKRAHGEERPKQVAHLKDSEREIFYTQACSSHKCQVTCTGVGA